MTAKIYLIDTVKRTVDFVEKFSGKMDGLKGRLDALQAGYCEDEKPHIVADKKKINGFKIIHAISFCDFSYIAKIEEPK